MAELKGNKGEWSEVYALLKILAESKLHSADAELNKTGSFIEVLSALRDDKDILTGIAKEVSYIADGSYINIIDAVTGTSIEKLSKADLEVLAKEVFEGIKAGKGSSFTLNSRLVEKLNAFAINKVKEKSSNKGDINLMIHDPSSGLNTNQKFSIKSLIGNSPTLFNSNKTTNIIYQVMDKKGVAMSQKLMEEINAITTGHKYVKRLQKIKEHGFEIQFSSYENETFFLNLQLIDTSLPEILAFAVFEKFNSGVNKMSAVIENLREKNPLGFNLEMGHNFYEYRIVNFLVEVALGMTSAKVWTGVYDAIGGLIVVKDNSDVLCFHLINFNIFKDFLKNSTKLDSPSGGRHGYGVVYEEEGRSFIKLNFQIRS